MARARLARLRSLGSAACEPGCDAVLSPDAAVSGSAMTRGLLLGVDAEEDLGDAPERHRDGADDEADRELAASPLAMRWPNSSGPVIPPSAVPTAKKNAIARARVSIGKISLTVR